MKAEIIAVGSELLTPDRLDTNSLFLTEELNKLGIEVLRKTIVGDDRELMSEAFRDALNRVPLIVSSGGLGPTEDDLTRETVAELLGRNPQSLSPARDALLKKGLVYSGQRGRIAFTVPHFANFLRKQD